MPSVAAVPASGQKREVSQSEIRQPQVSVRKVTKKDVEQGVATAKRTSLIFGREFEAPVRKEGEVVGQLTARISNEQVIRRILGSATEDSTEVPFALDREGTIYTRNPDERALLERLGVPQRLRKGESLRDIEGWIVTSSTDSQSGLRIGVARPVGENLDELRNTAARNFSLGMGLIAFALIGIVPLTNHLTRDVKVVTEGAERIAHGDLMTRLPVKSKNELGQLARAFNRMAEDLSHQQQRLLEQERARKEQELQQRLMSVEYERKSVELEEARRFQLSMLPKELPQHERYDVAVYTRTATEVGGDYYDFHLAGDVLSVTIGDATGHGAKAGTMVTIVKTLFSGYDGATGPAAFLHNAAEKIKRMDLGRMAMALSLGRLDPRSLTLSSAGMPPVLVHRAATSAVEEVALNATPLGTLGSAYDELTVTLAAGDTVLFLTDGFPELMNDAGQQLGYGAALEAFAEAARGASAAAVIEGLAAFAARWHGDAAPNDDVTFVVVRMA
jgi:serine phosphatase RsbU (regulator of sigma subunit)